MADALIVWIWLPKEAVCQILQDKPHNHDIPYVSSHAYEIMCCFQVFSFIFIIIS